MLKPIVLFSFGPLLYSLGLFAQTPTTSNPADRTEQVKVVVATPDHSSDTVIAIPPDTSWTGSIAFRGSTPAIDQTPGDVSMWIQAQSALNGLESTDLNPWHIVIEYDQFDEDGDNVHSGVVEEFWAGPKKYKISYKSDALNQTDYATDHGLFRLGDQRWPNRAETKARTEIINPFSYAATLLNFHKSSLERTFGTHSVNCVVLERTAGISAPTQYCFDKDSAALRYVRGEGWYQTVYNDIVSIESHHVGRDVEITDGGHPFLKLRVKNLETIPRIEDSDFTPPPDAVNLASQRAKGVVVKPINQPFPEWPNSLRGQHFRVDVEIVIGKDGHVTSAHAISGLSEAYKAAENAIKKWVFQPYLVLGEPVEVESRVALSNN
ncbi:MAG TPA: energy transducer TonB [Edaphobacter sp.]|jgi:hypothetical protein|nr:energy transducer TonB [Edaphobacter sp.]